MVRNLKHLTIYTLVIIGYWFIIELLPISVEYGIVAFLPFTLISSKIISTRWPITACSLNNKEAVSSSTLMRDRKSTLVYHSSYSHVERMTIIKTLQQVIERCMDKFWATHVERVQALQTFTLVFILLVSFLSVIRIIGQQVTPRNALLDIAAIVIIAIAAPSWWLVRSRIKNRSRKGVRGP